MRKLLFFALILSFESCHKLDDYIDHGGENDKENCSISEQSVTLPSGSDPGSLPMYFKKTYYPDNRPKTLYAVLQGNFGRIDTLEYLFTYSGNQIAIRLYARGIENFLNPYPPDTTNFTAELNTSGYVTQIDRDVFTYQGEKLIQYDQNQLEYDSVGNLVYIKLNGLNDPITHAGLQYQYDYSQKAGKGDFYKPALLNFGRNYCLAEVMGWIPNNIKNRRTREIYNGGLIDGTDIDYILYDLSITDHTYSSKQLLTSFKYGSVIVHNEWHCYNN